MRYSIRLILFPLLLFAISLGAQDAYLEVVCYVENSQGEPLKTAKADLFENGSKVKTVSADLKGKISLNLDFDKTYKIVVSKDGMIQKRIDFKTEVAPEDQRRLKKEFAMSLVENCEGANVSAFNEPADVIQYDAGFGNFISDNSHFERMQARFAEAYRNLEKCKQDKFAEKKAQGDQQLNQGNYEEAIAFYEEALKVFPNDGSTKRQISNARKSIEKQQANTQRYSAVIEEAEQFLVQNNLNAAKQRFAEAQKLMPNESLPGDKIAEINATLAAQAAEAEKQQALNAEYNGYMKQGNEAMASQNYALAQQMFEKASAIKPNEAFATQKIAEAQQAFAKQQADKAEQERVNNAYQQAIAAANAAMQQGDYQKAEELYQSALALKPTEALPRQKINEAQKLEAERQRQLLADQKAEIERKYNEAISSADALRDQKKYPESITTYEQALVIKPSDNYAQQQIVRINNLIIEEEQARLAAIEKQYNDAIMLGDAKKLAKEYTEAIGAYNQALIAKPNDPLAESRLAEAQKLQAEKVQLEKEENENRAQYNEFIQKGDGLFQSQDYEGSKTQYQQALAIYANEQYPKNQITKIDNLIAKNLLEAEYNGIISEADRLFDQQQWEEAKNKYGQAISVLPEKTYPRQKINEINQKISNDAKAAIEAEYNNLTAQAEVLVAQKNYDQAKGLYSQAQQVMPENPFPQQRINEINQLISEEVKASTQAKFDNLLAQAEQQVTTKNYAQAKSLLSEAMLVLPNNPFPQQRINEINKLIDDEARKGTMDKYSQLIAQADVQFDNENYAQAKSEYTQALEIMPNETYPQQQINKINQIISVNARQKVLDEYNTAIAQADQFFEQKEYSQATSAYSKAKTIMPEQTYPQQKINEISSILAAQAKQASDRESLENQYIQTIALADKHFNDKNYTLATSEYSKALTIKPGESYPTQQMERINQLIAEQQQIQAERLANEEKFNELILTADEQFKERNYASAKGTYQDALNYKPGDAHATSQLKRIDKIVAEALQASEKQKQTQLQYTDLIASADGFYNSNKLKDAKKTYLAALEIIPGSEYPRSQIRKIDEKLRIIAANNANVRTVTTSPAVSTPAKTASAATSVAAGGATLNDDNFKSESDKQKYLEELKNTYSPGVTKEIYKTNNATTYRYIVIRKGEVNEYRETKYKWGGAQYKVNGKPTNSFYLRSQVKPRDGESYTEVQK